MPAHQSAVGARVAFSKQAAIASVLQRYTTVELGQKASGDIGPMFAALRQENSGKKKGKENDCSSVGSSKTQRRSILCDCKGSVSMHACVRHGTQSVAFHTMRQLSSPHYHPALFMHPQECERGPRRRPPAPPPIPPTLQALSTSPQPPSGPRAQCSGRRGSPALILAVAGTAPPLPAPAPPGAEDSSTTTSSSGCCARTRNLSTSSYAAKVTAAAGAALMMLGSAPLYSPRRPCGVWAGRGPQSALGASAVVHAGCSP